MAVTFGKPEISSREVVDRTTGKKRTVYSVCITLENDGDAAVDQTVSFYYLERANVPKPNKQALLTTICTQTITVPARRVLPLGSMNGFTTVCCDLPGEPLGGLEIKAVVGTDLDSDGDASFSSGGNRVSTLVVPIKVRAESGKKISYSGLVGVGLAGVELLTLGGALDLPPGWTIEFTDPPPPGPYPVAVEFSLRPRPGAPIGEIGSVVLRSFIENDGAPGSIREELAFDFEIGPDPCCGDDSSVQTIGSAESS
jgi:hypothetical protein